MDYTAKNLRSATSPIRTIVLCLALVADQRCATLRAGSDIFEWLALRLACRKLDLDDFRNDFATLLDVDHIAQTNIQQLDLLGIMESCTLNNRSCQKNWLQVGYGGYCACSAHLKADAEESC